MIKQFGQATEKPKDVVNRKGAWLLKIINYHVHHNMMVADNFIAFMSLANQASVIPLHHIGITLCFPWE
jgi:hypothetical protein